MTSDQKIHIIHNPLSGPFLCNKSRSNKKTSFTKYLRIECPFHIIQHPGDATKIVREAISSGAKLIVASGGDGTINEVVNGFFRERKLISQNCILGIINRGTGQGVAQSLRLPSTLKRQFQLLQSEAIRPIDIGIVTFRNKIGQQEQRLFVNNCQIGIGSDVVSNVSHQHKKFIGKSAFGLVAFLKLFSVQPQRITTSIDGRKPFSGNTIGIVIANGDRTGGGMKLVPKAISDDGLLDILFIDEMTLFNRILNMFRIYTGKHLKSKYFHLYRGRTFKFSAQRLTRITADGEMLGYLPAEIEILSEKLFVKATPK